MDALKQLSKLGIERMQEEMTDTMDKSIQDSIKEMSQEMVNKINQKNRDDYGDNWRERMLTEDFPLAVKVVMDKPISEVETVNDYIVVKTLEEATRLIQSKTPSLKGKYVIVAPNGLEFVSEDTIRRLPIVEQLIDQTIQATKENFCTELEEKYTNERGGVDLNAIAHEVLSLSQYSPQQKEEV